MKKGCFVQSIIVLTIITAAILYIVNHKFNEYILNPGKGMIVKHISEELDYVKDSPEKDSLRVLIKDYVENLKSIKNLSNGPIDKFVDSLKIALQDSAIDKKEYKNLSKLLRSNTNYERPKKD